MIQATGPAPILAPSHNDTGTRPATLQDLPCPCGSPAVVVFQTELFGDMPWCGRADDGERVSA